MSQKINPVVAIVIAVVAFIAVIFVGVKMMDGGNAADGGSEGKAVIVNPSHPNNSTARSLNMGGLSYPR